MGWESLIALTAIVSIPFWGRLWYKRTCTGCRHDWDMDLKAQGLNFSCVDCGRTGQIDTDRWHVTCGKDAPSQRCGWPHCTPIRGIRDLPSQYRRSCSRLLVQFARSLGD